MKINHYATHCHNCRCKLKKPEPVQYEHETALCPDCLRECLAWNNYIDSVSQDLQPI